MLRAGACCAICCGAGCQPASSLRQVTNLPHGRAPETWWQAGRLPQFQRRKLLGNQGVVASEAACHPPLEVGRLAGWVAGTLPAQLRHRTSRDVARGTRPPGSGRSRAAGRRRGKGEGATQVRISVSFGRPVAGGIRDGPGIVEDAHGIAGDEEEEGQERQLGGHSRPHRYTTLGRSRSLVKCGPCLVPVASPPVAGASTCLADSGAIVDAASPDLPIFC